jgi:type VII secretion integral membrane protein EccD
MTLAPSLPDPDTEADSQRELSRVTVALGRLQFDVGLPTDVSIAAFIDEVIEIAKSPSVVQAEPTEVEFNSTEAQWTLGRVGAEPLDPNRSLAEFNVCDGELLVIYRVGMRSAPVLFDDVEFGGGEQSTIARRRAVRREAPVVGCFAVGLFASVAAALLLARQSITPAVVVAVLAAGAIGAVVACVLPHRGANAAGSPWLAVVAIPLIFAGSLHIVPGGFGVNSLPIAFGLTGFVALVVLLISGLGRSLCTAVIGLSVFGAATTISVLLWSPTPRAIGALLATTSMIVVYLAPRVTILLSKLPLPPVPTAGEPLDDIETQGGTTVEGVNAVGEQVVPTEEGMIGRVRTSNRHLTGIVVAATCSAVVGSYLAIDVSNGFFWQGTAFAIAISVVLCLRGRTHYDLVQSATLIGGGLLTGFALIVKTAAQLDDWRINAALAMVALMTLIVACGLIAPRLQFSPVMQRQVEILEYVAIALVFPLCFWIIRMYAFFRELSI